MKENKLPLVTIAIPTYNRANGYLIEALKSAMNQTYENVEIVVSDNCSTDNTEEIVKNYNDARIRYYKQKENIGPTANWNFCVEVARGNYMVLLHDDDLLDPDFVDVCIKEAQYDTSIGIIRTGTRFIREDGSFIVEKENLVGGVSTTDFFIGWFEGKTTPYLCSSMFNTKRLREIGGFYSKTDLFQDVIAEVVLAAKYGRVDVKEVKASFRRHNENRGTIARTAEWREDAAYLLDIICDLVPVEDRKAVRDKGSKVFSKWIYFKDSKITPWHHRFIALWNTYSMFNFRYSPTSFFYSNYIKPRLNLRYWESKIYRLI